MIITWSTHHIVIPGTTPLVAMALIEMAVSKVCKSNIATHPKTQPLPLTQQQHSKMMTSDCITPALPTIQVSLRNNITPRIFCSVGRYTPIIVPILTCDTQGYHWHTGISLTHRDISDTQGYQHRSLTIHGIPVTSMLVYRFFLPSHSSVMSTWIFKPFILVMGQILYIAYYSQCLLFHVFYLHSWKNVCSYQLQLLQAFIVYTCKNSLKTFTVVK